ISSLIF
ncbi:unnamed protein product, partial [Leptidea sinapis]